MATQNIDVRVNTGQAVNALNGLRSALGAVTAAFSVRAIAQFSDSIQGLQNRLRSLNPNAQEVTRQFDALVKIANSSRAPLESVGDLFFRIARSADQVGISIAEAAEITDSLAKGMAASGLSAAEAAGPLLQIGQALQSGRFQGDELRSVLEGMPVVARALADELNVPIGALRKLGSEGKITADVFVRAMKSARGSIVESFGRTLPTISQAMTVLRNSTALAFNEFETSTRTGQTVARVIEYIGFTIFRLTKGIDDLIGPILLLVKVVSGLLIFSIIGRVLSIVTGAFGVLTTAVTRFWKLATATTATTTLWSNALRSLGQVVVKVGAAVLAFLGIDKIGQLFEDLGDNSSQASRDLEEFRRQMQDFQSGLSTAIPDVQQFNTVTEEQRLAVRGLVEEYIRATAATRAQTAADIDAIGATTLQRNMIDALTAALIDYQNQRQKILDKMDEMRAKNDEESKQQLPLLQAALEDLEMTYRAHSDAIANLVLEQERALRVEELRLNSIKEQQRAQDQLIALQNELAKLTLPAIEQKYYDIEAAADASARAAIRAEEARRGAPLDIEEQKKYYDQARRGNDALKRQTRELYEASRTFATGWRRAFNEYVERATDSARQAEKIFGTFTQGLEDLIVDFVKTGKFEWKSFVDSILEELLRSQIQQTLGGLFETLGLAKLFGGSSQTRGNSPSSPLYVQAVSGGIGGQTGGGGLMGQISNVFSGGGQQNPIQPSTATPGFGGGGGLIGGIAEVATGIGKFAKNVGGGLVDAISGAGSWINKNLFGGFFANGGSLPAGKFGIVGERGPEMISGPATITPMGATQVTYNISAVDAASFQALVARDPGFIYAVTEQGRRSVPARR